MSVTLAMHNDIAVVEFDDGNRNVVNHDVLDALETAWDNAERDAAAIVLKGRDGSFCAGYDIKVMTGSDRQASARLGARGGKLAERIYACSKPVVGLAQGHAFTIGLLWLAGCDVRIGERGSYRMGMTEVALGVPLSGWALEPMRERVKREHQTPALLHSTQYGPEGALEVGYIDHLADAGKGHELALERAAALAALPPTAYRETKLALRQPVLERMRAGLPA